MGSDVRIDQLKGCSPESCLSWLRSHKGCPKHDLFMLEYSKCAKLSIDCLSMLRLSCKSYECSKRAAMPKNRMRCAAVKTSTCLIF